MNAHLPSRLIGPCCVLAALALGACSRPQEPLTAPIATPATAETTAPAASAVDSNVADGEITTHVKTALMQDDVLKAFDIGVETLKGDVRLTGQLDTSAQIADAIRITRASDGVHSVHDELMLKK